MKETFAKVSPFVVNPEPIEEAFQLNDKDFAYQ